MHVKPIHSHQRLRRFILAALTLTALCFSLSSRAIAAASCPPPPPVQHSLKAEPRYDQTQRQKQIVDEEAVARNAKSLANLRQFHSLIGRLSDEAVEGKPYASACLAALLDDWARADALLGEAKTNQGKYERQWALAGISLSAYKLQRSGHQLSRETLDWLERLAEVVKSEQKTRNVPNNLTVWAALGTGTAAVLTERDDLWKWSQNRIHLFLAQIEPDGVAPTELSRRERATGYHFFAGQPLLAFNRVAHCYGSTFDSEDQKSFDLFVNLLQELQAGKVSLAARAGFEQRPVRQQRWLPLLLGERGSDKPIDDVRIPQLGGSVEMLYRATQCPKP